MEFLSEVDKTRDNNNNVNNTDTEVIEDITFSEYSLTPNQNSITEKSMNDRNYNLRTLRDNTNSEIEANNRFVNDIIPNDNLYGGKRYNDDELDTVDEEDNEDNEDNEDDNQYGGKNDSINYLDSDSKGTGNVDSLESQLRAIYDKAREYTKRITDAENKMKGGEDTNTSEKKKRTVNKSLRLMLDITKKLSDSKKYPDIQHKHLMKVSKIIVDEAKKRTGKTEIDENVRTTALKLADNADEFVDKYRRGQDQVRSTSNSASKSNLRNRTSDRSNDRNSDNRSDNRSEWNDRDYTWKETESTTKRNYRDSTNNNNNNDRVKSQRTRNRSGMF